MLLTGGYRRTGEHRSAKRSARLQSFVTTFVHSPQFGGSVSRWLAEFGVGGRANKCRGGNVPPGLGLQDGDLERQRNERIPTFTTNYTIPANCPFDAVVNCGQRTRSYGVSAGIG